MDSVSAILPAVTLLGVGLLCMLAARALKTSPIVAFIAAGVVIGPSGLALVPAGQTVYHVIREDPAILYGSI